MAPPRSIRRSLLTSLIGLVILLGGALVLTTFLGVRHVVRSLSASIIDQTLDETEARMTGFVQPVERGIDVARQMAEAGLLAPDRPAEVRAVLEPWIRANPQVSSLMIADDLGQEVMILRLGETWRCRHKGPGTNEVVWWDWTDDEPEAVESREAVEYDPRTRPWYTGAQARRGTGDVHWTEPYTFFTTGDPGITASVTCATADGPGAGVIGFDVLLNDITAMTMALSPTENGMAFVSTPQRQIVGLPRDPRFETESARRDAFLKSAAELGIDVMNDGATAYQALPEDARDVFRFRSDGTPWWAGIRQFPLGSDRTLHLVVVVPEADLLGQLAWLRPLVLGLTLAALVAAVLYALRLARRFAEPIEKLVAQSERMSRGDLSPGRPVVSQVREVRSLADAHERMRRGLEALMKLERDLQVARQIQQGTFPEALPALPGFRVGAWSEPADETGGDTYDVVGYQSGEEGQIVISVEEADRALLLLADATGHGIGPALSVTQVRAMLRMAVRARESLEDIIRHLNEQLCEDLPEGRFITAWLGEIDVANRTLRTVSAGQGPILHYSAADDSFEIRGADTLPLGLVPDLDIEIREAEPIRPGDLVAVISDGIFEAADPDAALFGVDRVKELLRDNRQQHPDAIIESLREAVNAFTSGAPAADDQTGILIQGK